MSKILVTFFQETIITKNDDLICFYESFANELSNQGNEVKCLNVAFVKTYASDHFDLLSREQRNNLLESIKTFKPDMIFAFNNQITDDVLTITNCPVCLMEADLIGLWANIPLIKRYIDRYFCLSISNSFLKKQYELIGFNNEKILNIHLATSIQNENKEKTKNISFIGSNFQGFTAAKENIFTALKESRRPYDILIDFFKNYKCNIDELLKNETELKGCSFNDVCLFFNMRTVVLNSLFDLDLHLYGTRWEEEKEPLLLAYDPIPVYSLKHNSDIYNSSKINISISHPQCNGYAFPWRIYDIMGSGGVLVSSYSELLKQNTTGFVDIPMFDNPFEARNLCIKLLKEQNLREDIIAKSNEFIEKNGRWIDNFKSIEQLTGVKLCSNRIENSHKNYEIIRIKNKNKIHLKKYFKNFVNGILLTLSCVPPLNFFFTKKMRKKLYKSIEKWK